VLKKISSDRRGFTLIEVLVVVTLIGILTIGSLSVFRSIVMRSQFAKTANSVVEMFEVARTQALASRLVVDSSNSYKLPTGGYGVFLDNSGADQRAVFFINDWNASVNAKVNMDYGDVVGRVVPDHAFTDPGSGGQGDTVLRVLKINTPKYVSLSGLQVGDSAGGFHSVNQLTTIFLPPYAETIISSSGGDYFSLVADFSLLDFGNIRKITLDKIRTSAEITKQ